jgi:hypothetical protein
MIIGSFNVARRLASGAPREVYEFDFCGERFRVMDDDPSALPFLELADAIHNGVDTTDMQGMAAMYRMLKGCIHAEDWPRFRKTAMDHNAAPDDILPIVGAIWEAVTGRPTPRPSDSPDGPSTTGTVSKVDSSSPVTAPPSPEPTPPPDSSSPVSVVDQVPGIVLTPPGWPKPPPGREDLLQAQILVSALA